MLEGCAANNRAVSNFIVPFERPDYATRNSVSLTKKSIQLSPEGKVNSGGYKPRSTDLVNTKSSYNNVVIQGVWFGFVKVALEVFNHQNNQ